MNELSVAFTRAELRGRSKRFLTKTISTGLRMMSELQGIPHRHKKRGVCPFQPHSAPLALKVNGGLFIENSFYNCFLQRMKLSWPIS